jgi:metallo-beta-lactamase family protein
VQRTRPITWWWSPPTEPLHKGAEDSLEELADAVRTTFSGRERVHPRLCRGPHAGLLYIFNKLVREGRLASPLDIYVTARWPMRPPGLLCASRTLRRGGETPLRHEGEESRPRPLHHCVQESMRLNQVSSGAIIMAGSGMCEGGRIPIT